jgi:acyl-coenzyme A thioesterase PaaI-like protein
MGGMEMTAIQDQLPDNQCWGCGAENPEGLQLKSRWDGALAVAEWRPSPFHAAGPPQFVNGGIIATILDCHGVCTALADAYDREGRAIGSAPELWFATTSITVDYLRPTPIDALLELSARVVGREGSKTIVDCLLVAGGKERARASVEAIKVPEEWRHGRSVSM